MSQIIQEPFKYNFCKNCYYHQTIQNGSRVCIHRIHKPVRKIESCTEYISKELVDPQSGEIYESWDVETGEKNE